MKRITNLIIVSFLVMSWPLHSQSSEDTITKSFNVLIGEWNIDLRPTPESEGYYQKFKVDQIDGRTFQGTFYGSTINDGYINNQWKRLYFAFSTSDSSNSYYHSGYILEGKIYGISYCPGRAFTAPWTGSKDMD